MTRRFSMVRNLLILLILWLYVIGWYNAFLLCKVCFRSDEHRCEQPLYYSHNEYWFFLLEAHKERCLFVNLPFLTDRDAWLHLKSKWCFFVSRYNNRILRSIDNRTQKTVVSLTFSYRTYSLFKVASITKRWLFRMFLVRKSS
jgi:hypothetical protein